MKYALPLLLTLGGVMSAQTMPPPTDGDLYLHTISNPIDYPKTPREYALSRLKAADDYFKQKEEDQRHRSGQSTHYWNSAFSYTFLFGDKRSSFSVDLDGHVAIEGMTAEDALVYLAAQESDRNLELAKKWDEEEDAKRDTPPPPAIHANNIPVRVEVIDRWSPYIEADSNCAARKIRLVNSSKEKRESMLHEMMHVASNCSQDEQLHRAIQQISPKLLQMMRSNPKLVEWMMQPDGTKAH